MKLIAISQVNTASKNIGKILLKKYKFKETKDSFDDHPVYQREDILLVNCKEEVLNLEYLEDFKPDILVIASTHYSEAGRLTLTCHVPGVWSDDITHGGEKRKLSIAPALYQKAALDELKKLRDERKLDKYEVSLEVTHHGPSIDVPVLFVEVGSSEEQWNDLEACELAADVIYKILTEPLPKIEIGVGFGGTHYAPIFTKKMLENKFAIGHICPQYQMTFINEKLVKQAFEKTIPKPDFAVIEWKGLNKPQRDLLINIFEKIKIKWIRI